MTSSNPIWKRLLLAASVTTMAGCAALATDDAVVKRTAFALGLDKSDFVISNRQNEGAQATYLVTTKSGKKFNCYVEGYFSYTSIGEASDAMCVELGGKGKADACNALLKKAGKC